MGEGLKVAKRRRPMQFTIEPQAVQIGQSKIFYCAYNEIMGEGEEVLRPSPCR
jgi:hypothetical protein